MSNLYTDNNTDTDKVGNMYDISYVINWFICLDRIIDQDINGSILFTIHMILRQ
jgi:hypothetical protein